MPHTFLLELGLEEMPAKVIKPSVEQLKNKVQAYLEEANLDFKEIRTFSTPRRLTIKIADLAEMQPDDKQLVKGPAKKIAQDAEGNWSKAAIGFTRGQGTSTDDIVFKEVKGVEYIYVEKFTKGKTAAEILADLPNTITSLTFPVSMKWNTHTYKFIRPLHWLVALLDQDILPMTVFGIEADRTTKGHRFLGETVTLESAEAYEATLENQFVIVDRNKRQSMIEKQITDLCAENGWKVPLNNIELLDEVTDLVEYPTAFSGSFNEEYLNVPEVALEVSMADHQRYFPVRKEDETQAFLPNFIGIRNGSADHIETVVRGNEKVLDARLADAKFFYEEDQKLSIESFVEKLKRVSFHEKLGSMYDKQKRVSLIAQILSEQFDLSPDEKAALKRVGEFFKFDLVSSTVIEFTKLQGQIGAILAKEKGESDLVCAAVAEQYLPTSATGDVPSSKVGTVLSLADKLDTLMMFFAIGQIPSGSNDPFALRRQAMGIVKMIEQSSRHFSIAAVMSQIEEQLPLNVELKAGIAQNQATLIQFLKDRIDQLMQTSPTEQSEIAHDIRQSVLNAKQSDIVLLMDTASVLNHKKEDSDYKSVIESLNRVSNLAQKADSNGRVSETLFESNSESALYTKVMETTDQFKESKRAEDRYEALKSLSTSIDAFFEENMVMADNESVKQNRLSLLKMINDLSITFADTTQLLIK